MAEAPDEIQCYAAFSKGSPELGLPERLHGESVFILIPTYAGDPAVGRQVLEPLREFGDPIADAVQPTPYLELQQMFDERWAEGFRYYWKSHLFDELTDDAIETIVDHCDSSAPFMSVFTDGWLSGAISQAGDDATAFPHRQKAVTVTVCMQWEEPDRDEKLISWAREFHRSLEPYASEGAYVNFLDQDDEERVPAAYGEWYDRLRRIKGDWDPANLFRVNKNIEPKT